MFSFYIPQTLKEIQIPSSENLLKPSFSPSLSPYPQLLPWHPSVHLSALFSTFQCSLSASKESFLRVGGDPDGPDGILEGSWLQRKAPGLIIIFYDKAIVSFDGVLRALRGPNLRAYANIENKLCLL